METLITILNSEVKGINTSLGNHFLMVTYKTKSQLNKIKNVFHFLNVSFDLIEANKAFTVKIF